MQNNTGNSLRIIIIEDEKIASDLLEQMLIECDDTTEVLDKCYDLPSSVKSIKKYQPDLVFLDIELPVYSGLQLLDFFDISEINFAIIFTTASNKYAIRAFEMSAVDYILKPIQKEKLEIAVAKFYKQQIKNSAENILLLSQNTSTPELKKIVIPVSGGYEILIISDIVYFKAEGSYTRIFLANKQSFIMSKNLKYFHTLLEDNELFVRIHRSFVVNISYAKRIVRNNGYFLVFDDDLQLPIINEKVVDTIKLIK